MSTQQPKLRLALTDGSGRTQSETQFNVTECRFCATKLRAAPRPAAHIGCLFLWVCHTPTAAPSRTLARLLNKSSNKSDNEATPGPPRCVLRVLSMPGQSSSARGRFSQDKA
jgi:hypothetical protein